MPNDPDDKTRLLDALRKAGSASEVDLQVRTMLDLKRLRAGLKALADEELVTVRPEQFPDFGGTVELTVKGLRRAR